jgi:hypothetical protein
MKSGLERGGRKRKEVDGDKKKRAECETWLGGDMAGGVAMTMKPATTETKTAPY